MKSQVLFFINEDLRKLTRAVRIANYSEPSADHRADAIP